MSKKVKETPTIPATPDPSNGGELATPNPSNGGELATPNPSNGVELQQKADRLFATHSCSAFYFTADGTAFSQLQNARLHAANLKDDKIITIKKQETE